MRSILILVALASLPAIAAPPDLAGTWNVTSTELAGAMCPSEPGKVWAHQWLVSTNPDGSISVKVQGETSFPLLTGTPDAKGKIVVVGFSEPRFENSAWFADSAWLSLEVKGGQLVGLRRFFTLADVAIGKRERVKVPCFLDMSVVAKR